MNAAKVPDFLRRAATLIEQRGWIQGVSTHTKSGSVDLTGAIALAFGVPEEHLSENMDEMAYRAPGARYAHLLAAYDFIEGFVHEYPPDYNDNVGRTEGQVLKMLRDAAAELEATI